MAKSNPIGVRFDEKIIEKYPDLTPQKILNKLTEQDLGTVKIQDLTTPTNVVEPVKPLGSQKSNIVINTLPKNIPPMPVKEVGENSFDYAERKNEWKKKYNQ